jgi:hydroxyethylthiazole kinase-like uncharacterized protein yjeF
MISFSSNDLKKLFVPRRDSSKGQNGQVTIIGGSRLFHGAPLFSLVTASRIVDMVFFASPDPSVGEVASKIKSKLLSFIWVPWEETEQYIKKSDSVLIGPGFMRFHNERDNNIQNVCDEKCKETTEITKKFLLAFPNKKWVIDAGSLQVLNPNWIPNMAILTPNKKEYEMIFGKIDPESAAKKHNCVIALKGPTTFVYSPGEYWKVEGGNPGLTKGGSGDVEAGLTVALLAKNEPILAAAASSYIIKKAADLLYEEVGTAYNSDDLAARVPSCISRK